MCTLIQTRLVNRLIVDLPSINTHVYEVDVELSN